jgi:hypothetical protein
MRYPPLFCGVGEAEEVRFGLARGDESGAGIESGVGDGGGERGVGREE